MCWISQLINILKYIYFKSVIYSDILCYNIFLDKYLNIKLINFTSSSINGSPLLTSYFI